MRFSNKKITSNIVVKFILIKAYLKCILTSLKNISISIYLILFVFICFIWEFRKDKINGNLIWLFKNKKKLKIQAQYHPPRRERRSKFCKQITIMLERPKMKFSSRFIESAKKYFWEIKPVINNTNYIVDVIKHTYMRISGTSSNSES